VLVRPKDKINGNCYFEIFFLTLPVFAFLDERSLCGSNAVCCGVGFGRSLPVTGAIPNGVVSCEP